MKSLRKPVCLLLAVLMVISISACSAGKQTDQPAGTAKTAEATAPKAESTQSATKAQAPSSGQWKPVTDLSKHVEFTYTSVQAIDGYDYTKGDPLAEYYSKKFNYTMNVTALTWDNWNERLRIWINSGDMPDVACYNFNFTDAKNFVDQGLLYKLPENWKTRWPNAAKVEAVTSLGPQMDSQFGGTYFLPRARFYNNLLGDPLPNHYSLYMRADWANAVGFPLKSTYKVSEVMDFAKLIKDKDPGKVGKNLLPIAACPNSAVEFFIYRNSTYFNNFYKDPADGKYKWGAASQDTLRGLKLFQQAYRTGILNPDFYTVKSDEDTRQFDTQGVAAADFGQAPTMAVHTNLVDNYKANLKLDPFTTVNMASVLGEDGYFHQRDLINFWGTVVFSPKISKEKFERYMDILDYNATKEGSTTLNMGVPEKDWTWNSDGTVKSLYTSSKPLSGTNGTYPSWGYLLGAIVLFDDFAFNNPNLDQKARDTSRRLYSDRVKTSTPQTFAKIDWPLYEYKSPSMNKVQFDYNTELCNLVTMEGDLTANWQKWIESKNPLIQPVLEELNTKLK